MNGGRQSRGMAVIELALVFPIFAYVALLGLEFSRSLNTSQASAAFSRQAVSTAFRDCVGKYNYQTDIDPEAAADVLACLEQHRAAVETFARRKFSGAEVIISMFRYEDPAAECSGALNADIALIARADGSLSEERRYRSRFNFTNGGTARGAELSGGLEKITLCINRAVITAEVFLPYRSVSGIAAAELTFNPTEYYSAAVM